MPTQETNTAADRLLRIMRDVAASRNDTLVKVWSRVLGLQSSEKLEVFRGILSLAALVDEIETTVRKHGGSATPLYLRSLDKVRLMLMVNIENHANALNEILKPDVISDLEHCAALYANVDHEIPVAKEQIEEIKDRVEQLFRDISDSTLPEELRLRLLDLLEVIRQQLSQFEIRGATSLHECLRQSLARMMEIYPAVQQHRDNTLLKRVASVITDIGAICENAQKALPILKVAAKLLPLFSGGNNHHVLPEAVDVEVLTSDTK